MSGTLLTFGIEYAILLGAYGENLEDIVVKKLQLIVFSVIVSVSGIVFATGSPILGSPTPLQSYQSASSGNSSSSNDNSKAVQNKVAQIMAQSKQAVQEGKVKPTSDAAVKLSNTQATPAAAPVKKLTLKSNTNSEVASELEQQMNTLNQATLMYQQNTNQKIEMLTSQNAALQGKLEKLTEAMVIMNQQLSQMSNGQHSVKLPKDIKATTHHDSLSGLFKYFAFGLVALLAVLMGVMIGRQKKQGNNVT